jgi:hypothetical protein
VSIICFNFMPVVDWTRANLGFPVLCAIAKPRITVGFADGGIGTVISLRHIVMRKE